MSSPQKNESLVSAVSSKTYAAFGADIDLTAQYGTVCRRIRINSAGTGALTLKYGDDTTDTITGLQQGDVLDVQAKAIVASGTNVASVTVFW